MNGTTHSLVARYLDDLARMLGDLEPGERAEVLAGVREHIEGALGDQHQDDAAVAAVLTELGPPDAIAQAAYADRAVPPVPPAAPRAARIPITSRPWVPVVVALLQGLSLLLVILVVGGSVAWVEGSGATSTGETEVTTYGGSSLAAVLAGGLAALPLWTVMALLVGISALWTSREKVAHLLAVPVAAVLFAAGPTVGGSLAGKAGMIVVAWTVLAVVVAGGGWLLYRLTVSGRRRAARTA
ncbi:hypothetical protein [Intrasporangium sp. DVR]|uniref:HAAS signaling domain-containing protein n=1 Tax=Intrasporangium sp. DVR TaxID=3127867 RepID=UPI00313A711B